ncbi:MAG: hypothetical protein S0880_27905 [Actinomycetota bacterium]|nr:hypothetical protein [Actinomycetota bacterium]
MTSEPASDEPVRNGAPGQNDRPATEIATRRPESSPAPLRLDDLPSEVRERLDFDTAAPASLRSAPGLPSEARDVMRAIWNGLVADVYDEMRGSGRRALFDRTLILRVLDRLNARIDEANRLMIVVGAHAPMPGSSVRHVGVAAGASGLSAGVTEIVAFGSAGTAAAASVTAAVVGELFETYLAASARVGQYRRAGRLPGPEVLAHDLAEALGRDRVERVDASRQSIEALLRWLANQATHRMRRRLLKGLIPVVGIGASATTSAFDMRKVLSVPMRVPDASEISRLAEQAAGTEPYSFARRDFERLLPPVEARSDSWLRLPSGNDQS